MDKDGVTVAATPGMNRDNQLSYQLLSATAAQPKRRSPGEGLAGVPFNLVSKNCCIRMAIPTP